jgi:hypothetical protein
MIFAFAASQGGGPSSAPGGPGSILIPFGFMAFFGLHILTVFELLVLKVFYIVHAARAEYLDQNMKLIWILLFVFATIIAEPIFWYLYIWREPARANSPQLKATGVGSTWANQDESAQADLYSPPSEPPDWR